MGMRKPKVWETHRKKLPPQITRDAKRAVLMQEIAKGELPFIEIVEKYSNEWGISKLAVQGYIRDTVAFLQDEGTKETLAASNIARLDKIYSDSMIDKDRKTAIKAIETQGKYIGAFEEKVKLDTDKEVNFTFNIGDVGDVKDEDDGSKD